MPRKQPPLSDLIEARSIPEPNTGCRLWLGSHVEGYATIVYKRQAWIVNRLQLGLEKGSTAFALHKCDNRACVEIRHLYVGTVKDNFQDAIDRGRTTRGTGGRFVPIEEGYAMRHELEQLLNTLGIEIPKKREEP